MELKHLGLYTLLINYHKCVARVDRLHYLLAAVIFFVSFSLQINLFYTEISLSIRFWNKLQQCNKHNLKCAQGLCFLGFDSARYLYQWNCLCAQVPCRIMALMNCVCWANLLNVSIKMVAALLEVITSADVTVCLPVNSTIGLVNHFTSTCAFTYREAETFTGEKRGAVLFILIIYNLWKGRNQGVRRFFHTHISLILGVGEIHFYSSGS